MKTRKIKIKVLSAAVIACFSIGALQASAAKQDPSQIASQYLQQNQHRFGLTGSDTREATIGNIVPGSSAGVSHVYLQQRFRGIPVWNGIVTLNILPDGSVINPGNRFIPNLAAKAGSQNARKNSMDAARAAADFLDLKTKQPFRVLKKGAGPGQKQTLSTGGIAARPIDAELVWYMARDMGQLRLAWKLDIEQSGNNWWYAFVDAGTGEPLAVQDLVVRDKADAIASGIAHAVSSSAALAASKSVLPSAASFASIDGSTYTVFPQPMESPSDGARAAVSGAADPTGSPFGWHDDDGADGAEYTVTRGNNAHAYTDTNADNVADAGSDPDGGPSLTFDFPLSLADDPSDYRPAAVTNLFYWNNVIHDIAYRYGFNEASGNFQQNNYGNGGLDGDYVRAEAQDGSGTNNANFSTPVDGFKPRMQMYQWTTPQQNIITISSPVVIAGDYFGTGANFGPRFKDSGPKAGVLTYVNDGVGAPGDGCEALVGFPAGAIALVDRGSCNFTIKVKNAQNAGASAVVVANNVPGATITLGGADGTITIPSTMVSFDEGNLFKANLPADVSIAANPLGLNRDSDLDNGIIAHEYGHGISIRLTGGPGTNACLTTTEQMGEGWSDWFALTLTTRPSDTAATARGVGSYVVFEPADGAGIRPTPYSTDLSVNPSTYAWVANPAISQPHGIGYVWNTMLWEVYWNLVHKHGYNADIYDNSSSAGNILAFQLVMDGLKMQPCNPGFVDGRDAILAADVVRTGGANQCEIWSGFAKRGLGVGADQGDPWDRFDGVPAFGVPATCPGFGGFSPPLLPPPQLLVTRPGSNVPVKFSLNEVEGPVQLDTQEVNCSTLEPTGAAPIALNSKLGLIQSGNDYQIDWKTDKSWGGTCRVATLHIEGPFEPTAYFRFK